MLETKIGAAMSGGETLSGFVASVASSAPVPGGGSVVAHVGALGAALARDGRGTHDRAQEVRRRRARDESAGEHAVALGNRLAALVKEDSDSYALVSAAYKLPKETADQAAARDAAIQAALMKAAAVPLETARACVAVAKLAVVCAQQGNANAVSDAGVAALLAEAACKGAAYNVRINVVVDERSARR